MLPGLDLFTGGGGLTGGAATSGPATQGNQGVNIGGLQTGGSQGASMWMIAAIAAAAIGILLLVRRR